ncbi:hypothetical protein [Rhodopseudomonas sp. B29]|nr:hypothetical protein [Rhodopseudomonas sp. B29]
MTNTSIAAALICLATGTAAFAQTPLTAYADSKGYIHVKELTAPS